MQITNIRKEREAITTDCMDMRWIIQEYYEQFCAHRFDHLDEMDQFFKRHTLPKVFFLIQGEIEILNKSIQRN